MGTKRKEKNTLPKELHLSKARLDELVEEALVDAYGESEQATGFYTMLENDLRLPLPSPLPAGAEWIVAYRYWRTGARR